MDFSIFLPDGITPAMFFLLLFVSLISSTMTAMISVGGGILMISVLALIFPPAVVVPVHGTIQLGSNFSRVVVHFLRIQWRMVGWISLGAVMGAALGGKFASYLPDQVFRFAIGIFLLLSIWLPRPDVPARGPVQNFFGGLIISFLAMIVGVAGPLVLNLVRDIKDRRALIGTHAFLMTVLNASKISAFIFFGFAFGAYLPLILAIVAAGFVGTLIGTRMLVRMREEYFRIGLKIIVTILALDLLRRAIFGA